MWGGGGGREEGGRNQRRSDPEDGLALTDTGPGDGYELTVAGRCWRLLMVVVLAVMVTVRRRAEEVVVVVRGRRGRKEMWGRGGCIQFIGTPRSLTIMKLTILIWPP